MPSRPLPRSAAGKATDSREDTAKKASTPATPVYALAIRVRRFLKVRHLPLGLINIRSTLTECHLIPRRNLLSIFFIFRSISQMVLHIHFYISGSIASQQYYMVVSKSIYDTNNYSPCMLVGEELKFHVSMSLHHASIYAYETTT